MNLGRKTTNSPFIPDWLDDFFSGEVSPFVKPKMLTVPPVNVFENSVAYRIEMAIPGLAKENVKINLENDVLTIFAEKQEEEVEQVENCTKKEFHYETFSRSFALPEAADVEKIKAETENGVLKITISKKEQKVEKNAKEIKIS